MFLKPAQIVMDLKEKGYLLEGFVVADFGCGSGYFTALFAEVVKVNGRVKAIDINEDILNAAKEFIQLAGYNNVDFILADLEKNLPLEDSCCDLVFISQVLFSAKNLEKIISETKRVLKPSKYLVVIEPAENNPLFANQKTFTKEELESLLTQAGFEILESQLKENYYHLIVARK